jgi:hypothetical protein
MKLTSANIRLLSALAIIIADRAQLEALVAWPYTFYLLRIGMRI